MQAARGAAVAAQSPDDPAAPRRTAWLVVTAVVVFIADVVSKVIVVATLSNRAPIVVIPHVLRLTLTRNSGAAFSVGTGSTWLFTAVAVAVVVVIIRSARSLASRGWAISFGLLLGGALGNLTDRMLRAPGPLRGEVVDWLELPHWPVFNVADSAIVIGGVLAIVLALSGIELDGSRR